MKYNIIHESNWSNKSYKNERAKKIYRSMLSTSSAGFNLKQVSWH